MVHQSDSLTVVEMLDKALPLPTMGTIDFRMLHSLLNAIIKTLNLETLSVDYQSDNDRISPTVSSLENSSISESVEQKQENKIPVENVQSNTNVTTTRPQNLTDRIKSVESKIQSLNDLTENVSNELNKHITEDALAEKVNQLEKSLDLMATKLGMENVLAKTNDDGGAVDSVVNEIVDNVEQDKIISVTDQISMLNDLTKSIKSDVEHMEENHCQTKQIVESFSSALSDIGTNLTDLNTLNNELKTKLESLAMKSAVNENDYLKTTDLKTIKKDLEKKLNKLKIEGFSDQNKLQTNFDTLEKALKEKMYRRDMNQIMKGVNSKLKRNQEMLDEVMTLIKYGEKNVASAAKIEYVKDLHCMSCNQNVAMQKNEIMLSKMKAMKTGKTLQKIDDGSDEVLKMCRENLEQNVRRSKSPNGIENGPRTVEIIDKFCSCLLVKGNNNAIFKGDPLICKC